MRRSYGTAATIAVVTVAGLVLSSCGSRASDTAGGAPAPGASCLDTSGPSVKVGTVNSLSGATAINEVVIRDVTEMAIEQINADGGVLGKQLELISEDGASEPAVFAEKAQKLVRSDCVAAVFGGYTSASRKAMLPVFEDDDALLYYGTYYEGMEASPNIFYTGAAPNQQTVPALEFLVEQGVTSLYLVGSDYVYPRTSNAIVKAFAEAHGIEIKGEDYVPLGGTEFSTIANKIRAAQPDAVFNVVVGDSLVPFFREYRNSGMSPDNIPVISMSVGEEEIRSIGAATVAGNWSTWNYFQTLDSPENAAFVAEFRARHGVDRVTSDAMESAYTSIFLWREMVEKAGSFDAAAVREAADGVTFDAPEGRVTVDGDNNHIFKTARIGEIRDDGLIHAVWDSGEPIRPDPFLDGYDWAAELSGR